MSPIHIAIVGVGKIVRDQHLPALAANSDYKLIAAASRHGIVDGIDSSVSSDTAFPYEMFDVTVPADAGDDFQARLAWSGSANANAKAPEINPGPPPSLTRRGARILVRVEKLFDDAAKTVTPGKTSSNDIGKPAPPSSVAFPDSFASATSDPAAVPAPPRKN